MTLKAQDYPLRHSFNVHSFNVHSNANARTQVRNTMKTFEIKSASSSDRDVFEALTRDESDLVIDLNGFSRGERSSAMSSVPVSATYLGFPSSTGGLHDISITDSVATPVEISSHLYDESLLVYIILVHGVISCRCVSTFSRFFNQHDHKTRTSRLDRSNTRTETSRTIDFV